MNRYDIIGGLCPHDCEIIGWNCVLDERVLVGAFQLGSRPLLNLRSWCSDVVWFWYTLILKMGWKGSMEQIGETLGAF